MSAHITYDAAIIGGGLAGLTLAIQLQQQGLQTILFEKENYPFHKVCGEYISMESWPFLERLGIPLQTMQLPRINELLVSAPSGNYLTQPLHQGGFGISRFTLDNLLYKKALSIGVSVKCNTRVTDVCEKEHIHELKTTQEVYDAKLVFGTWGKRANLDVKLNRSFIQPTQRKLNDFIGVKYHIEIDEPENRIALHNFENGYCGISRIENNQFCLCYLTTATQLKKRNGDIRQMEEEVLYKNPFLKLIFKRTRFLYDKPLVISQISFEKKSSHAGNLLFAGDAAGLITPLCGNGMSMAMHASHILAGLVKQYKQPNNNIKDLTAAYHEAWNREFAGRLKAGRFIQGLFGNPLLTNLTISALKPMPFVTQWLIGKTHGKPF
jgi:flavin-dependent dehydrogenase